MYDFYSNVNLCKHLNPNPKDKKKNADKSSIQSIKRV